ncbi:enoyl-CoA hydratase/isomerase family protein [Colwelliaceae bacterium 6441]
MSETPVIFEEQHLSNGLNIAFATLNASKSLNALSLPMIDLLLPQLKRWLADRETAVIVLQGSGDKAFCAGGDVVSIYHNLVTKQQASSTNTLNDDDIKQSLGVEFFTKEYQLDQVIHNATKPILVWADGYVMGGGIGLMAGASHRVVTEKTIMAMPEVTIGLYPDVGASYFLNKMPSGVGLFLGLTGMTFNGEDAKFLGLADHQVACGELDALNKKLLTIDWSVSESRNHQLLSNLLAEYELSGLGHSRYSSVEQHLAVINKVTSFDHITDIYDAIINEVTDSPWFIQAKKKLAHGSPLSAHIIHRQLTLCQGLSLAECFEKEINLSLRCCQHGEFVEGVRALLVDKDKHSKWAYEDVAAVDSEIVNWFFTTIARQ